MDTRTKIVTAAAAAAIARKVKSAGGKLTVVAGTFEVLQAAHAAALAKVRDDTSPAVVMVVVLPSRHPLLPDRARAELVAALCMVDYVIIAGETGSGELLLQIDADTAICREAMDDELRRFLIDHVQRRHRT